LKLFADTGFWYAIFFKASGGPRRAEFLQLLSYDP